MLPGEDLMDDAWVEGDEDFVGFEFKSAATYAKA